jgi:hypothetical protein
MFRKYVSTWKSTYILLFVLRGVIVAFNPVAWAMGISPELAFAVVVKFKLVFPVEAASSSFVLT